MRCIEKRNYIKSGMICQSQTDTNVQTFTLENTIWFLVIGRSNYSQQSLVSELNLNSNEMQ